MAAPDLIVLGGAPGVGKSTLMGRLRAHFQYPPTIEFSDVRNLYLDRDWARASPDEEQMAFDILLYALKKILEKRVTPVLLTDFKDERLLTLQAAFGEYRYRIVTLFMDDDEIVKERVIARNDGFKDHAAAMRWNATIRLRPALPCEDKIKVDQLSEREVFELCLATLGLPNRV
jgi:predicted kinase